MKAVVRSEFLQFKAIAAELAQEKHSMFMSRLAVCFSQLLFFLFGFVCEVGLDVFFP